MTTRSLIRPVYIEVDDDDLLEFDTSLDAMVTCTPFDGDKPVLPTKQVPYAKIMEWQWHITKSVYVNRCLIVAKIEHHFAVRGWKLKPGDCAEIFVYASDLEHSH